MLYAFLHKQSHTPTHSPYCQVALMDAHPRKPLCVSVSLKSFAQWVMANAGVTNITVGDFQLVCVTEMLVSKDLVHQDLRGVQLHALEEECKKATRIGLDNYNQALVQYMHVHTQMDTQMYTHATR